MSLFPAFITARKREDDPAPQAPADLHDSTAYDSGTRDAAADDNVFNLLPPEPEAVEPKPEPKPIGQNRRPVDMTDLSKLSIDRDGHLYWDGKPVQTHHRFAMSRKQFIGAVVVSSFVVLGAIGAAIQGAAAARDWACRAGWISGGCTMPAPRPDIPA